MLRIKKLDLFIVKSFLTLFMGTFFICLFIFILQFLWKYVDELVGKGLEMTVLAEFFFYSAISLIPMALPLAVLLAALITFGNFGERYELLAMKAAGISLLKIMRPLIFFSCLLLATSFYFQNVIGPIAQAKLGTLLISMKQKSPEVDIPEGVFYGEIPGYKLKVGRKDRETGMLYDVLIYNMADGFENTRVIYADSGLLEMTADKGHLYLHLYRGELFENLKSQNMKSESVPYRRESFEEKHSLIQFNSDFNLADAGIMKNQASAKNMRVLQASIDSMELQVDSIGRIYYNEAHNGTYRQQFGLTKEDTLKMERHSVTADELDSLFRTKSLVQKQRVVSTATNRSETLASDYEFKSVSMESSDLNIRRHKIEWHKKLTLSLACLLFFFIGASLGGIIRKGGLGMPGIVSVLVFIIYFVIDNSGYMLARDGKWVVWMGMWTSSAVLAPLGIFLTYKSNKDSVVLNADLYKGLFKKFFGIRSVRNLTRKEVIIQDPEYGELVNELTLLTEACTHYLQSNQLRKAPNYIKLWFLEGDDRAIAQINEQLERLVNELSNSKSGLLLAALNQYPILSPSAHLRPFHQRWLHVAMGVVLPVGLFFYGRIWAFRVRLSNDLNQVIQQTETIKNILNTLINDHETY